MSAFSPRQAPWRIRTYAHMGPILLHNSELFEAESGHVFGNSPPPGVGPFSLDCPCSTFCGGPTDPRGGPPTLGRMAWGGGAALVGIRGVCAARMPPTRGSCASGHIQSMFGSARC